MASCLKNGLDHGVGHPWRLWDHAAALQHLRQEACRDSTVMLRGHKGPRRSARPMLSLLGFRMGGAMEGYMLWAVATSAGSPIVYGCFRPISGELPKGAYKFIGAAQWPTR